MSQSTWIQQNKVQFFATIAATMPRYVQTFPSKTLLPVFPALTDLSLVWHETAQQHGWSLGHWLIIMMIPSHIVRKQCSDFKVNLSKTFLYSPGWHQRFHARKSPRHNFTNRENRQVFLVWTRKSYRGRSHWRQEVHQNTCFGYGLAELNRVLVISELWLISTSRKVERLRTFFRVLILLLLFSEAKVEMTRTVNQSRGKRDPCKSEWARDKKFSLIVG